MAVAGTMSASGSRSPPLPARPLERRAGSSLVLVATLAFLASCFARRLHEPPPLPRGDAKVAGRAEAGAAPRLDVPAGRAFSIALHVDEPAGVERKGEPVLASVPFPPEAALRDGSEIAVVDEADAPLPVQARVLSRWDGRPDDATKPARWVLLAFEADVGANRTRPLRVVRRALDERPGKPVRIEVHGAKATLDAGSIRVALGGSGPIESVADERGTVLARRGRAFVREGDPAPQDGGDATTGAPESIEVLEPGPVRGVVRLLGHYATHEGEPGLAYALTVEAWAGRPELRLSLETRNSDRHRRRCIELSELALRLGLARPVESIASPEGTRPLSPGDAFVHEQGPRPKGGSPSFALGLEGGARLAEGREHEGWLVAGGGSPEAACGVVLRRPVVRAPSGVRVSRDEVALRFVAPGRSGDGAPVFQRWLGDLQHRTDDALVFFGATDASAAARAYRAPLLGQPNASWVRDAGGFLGPLPDATDEAMALGACGLEPGPRKPLRAVPPDAFVGEVNVKWDTETDDARDQLVRWVRTGDRGALDEGCAWVDFYRDRYAPRTDGFTFAEAEARGHALDVGEALEAAKRLDVSRLKESHVYGEGLVGHYLLTGERASLEAAQDIAELAAARFGKLEPSAPIVEMRVFARPLQTIVALVEVTGDEALRELLGRMVACAAKSRTRDLGRGSYAFELWVGEFDLDSTLPKDLSLPERFPGDAAQGLFKKGPRWLCIKHERAAFPYQDRELAHALARAFEVAHDERARQALLGLASFYLDEGIVPVHYRPELLVTPYFVLPYVPEPEVARYTQPSCPLYSTNLGLIEAAAYLASGDQRFLEQAKRCLRIACLRGHGDLRPLGAGERKIRIPIEGQWAHGWDDSRTFYALGARGERKPPAAVRDVVVRAGSKPGTVELGFAPGDERAARFLVLGSRLEIVAAKGDGVRTVGSFGAEPLATIAASPAKAKTRPAIHVVPVDGERSFVVLAEDASGALSAPSSVATLGE